MRTAAVIDAGSPLRISEMGRPRVVRAGAGDASSVTLTMNASSLGSTMEPERDWVNVARPQRVGGYVLRNPNRAMAPPSLHREAIRGFPCVRRLPGGTPQGMA